MTAKKKAYESEPVDVKPDNKLDTQFESSKASQHMLKKHGVMPKKKRARDSSAISAVALGGPSQKRMRAIMNRVGSLQSPGSVTSSVSPPATALPIAAACASQLVVPGPLQPLQAASQAASQSTSPGQLKFQALRASAAVPKGHLHATCIADPTVGPAHCQFSIGIAVACRIACIWLCTQRRPTRWFCGMCLPCAQSPRIICMMQPLASLIVTWMPGGHTGHASVSGFSAGVVRAACIVHSPCQLCGTNLVIGPTQ